MTDLKKRKHLDWTRALWLLVLVLAGSARAEAPVPQSVLVALRRTKELMQFPVHIDNQFDYIMTARVRLLLFWVGKDDVGGGYIRRGALPQDPASDVIELLIGSDPARAPRAINRWGAASEIVHKPSCCSRSVESSVFFGFMKVSNGTSAAEMEKELAREKQGGSFLFSAIINQGEQSGDFSKVVPISSNTDFTIHDFDQAKSMVFEHLLGSQGRVKEISSDQFQACGRREGFLESVAELVDDAVELRKTPVSACYFYNGELHQVTLAQVTQVPNETTQLLLKEEPHQYVRTYRDLVLARFEDFNQTNKHHSEFELLLGTTGSLKGVPVQIRYQPNWWFQVFLNLKAPELTAELRKPR